MAFKNIFKGLISPLKLKSTTSNANIPLVISVNVATIVVDDFPAAPSADSDNSACLLFAEDKGVFLTEGDVHGKLEIGEDGEMKCTLIPIEMKANTMSPVASALSFATTAVASPVTDACTLVPSVLSISEASFDFAPKVTVTSASVTSIIFPDFSAPAPRCATPAKRSAPTKRILDLDEFDIVTKLGEGGFGIVHLVTDKVSGKDLALKRVHRGRVPDEEIMEEQRIMRKLVGVKGVLPLLGSFEDDDYYCFLTKVCRGDLKDRIYRRRDLVQSERFRYMAELVNTIGELHKHRVLHRDIKAENIFLDGDHVVLGDYGLSFDFSSSLEEKRPSAEFFTPLDPIKDEGDVAHALCGTLTYMAPEIHKENYSYGVDVWAAGVTMYETFFGILPFGMLVGMHHAGELTRRMAEEPLTFMPEELLDEDGRDLLRQMLDRDPTTRITIEGIKQHPFFRSVDWNKVARQELDITRDPRSARRPAAAATNAPASLEPMPTSNNCFHYVSPLLMPTHPNDPDFSSCLGDADPSWLFDDAASSLSRNKAAAFLRILRTPHKFSVHPTHAGPTKVLTKVQKWWTRRGVVSVKPVSQGRRLSLD